MKYSQNPHRLVIDCNRQGVSGTKTSSKLLARVITGDGFEESFFEDESRCPEFGFDTDPSTISHIEVMIDGEDPLLADVFRLYSSSNLVQSWGEDEGGAACFSDNHNEHCWPTVANAGYPRKGATLRMDGSQEAILYENDHMCSSDDQCQSSSCIDAICLEVRL